MVHVTDRLVIQLQCKLQQARIADQAGDGTEGACICEIQVAWVSKLRMIEEVEHFHTELDFARTVYAEALIHARVGDSSARPAELVAVGVAENRRGDGGIG